MSTTAPAPGSSASDPFQLPNDWVLTIPIEALSSSGVVVALPAGDVETASVTAAPTSTTPGLSATIGTTASGGPALVVNALVDGSQTAATVYTVMLSDSAGEASDDVFFTIVPDNTPSTLLANLSGATHTTQPVPPPG